jgi:hypothetical protein
MEWKDMGKKADASTRGGAPLAATNFSRGMSWLLFLLLLMPALTSCIATRSSNRGLASITSFTASVWDNNNVADILPAEQYPTINPGEKIVLTWIVSGATSVSITDGSGAPVQNATVLSGNRIVVMPTVSTTYTLTVTGENGRVATFSDGLPATVTVNVVPPPVISSLTAASTTILSGQSTLLSWSVSNAASLTLYAFDPANFGQPGDALFGTQNVTGLTSFEVTPTVSTVYELFAAYVSDGGGSGGTPQANVTIQVQALPVSSVVLTATPTSILPGGSSTLSWAVTNSNYVTDLKLDAVDANHPPPGIQTDVTTAPDFVASPAITTTYTIIATNEAGVQSNSNAVTVTVTSCPVPAISQFSSDPVSASTGATANLTAVFNGGIQGDAGTGTIDNGIGAVTSGVSVATQPLTSSTTFHLNITNHCGASANAMTRVPVGKISYFGGHGLGLFFGLTNDANGNLYSGSDLSYEGCIYQVTPAGNAAAIAGSPDGACDTFGWVDGPLSTALFNDPTGVAIDPSENLYIADQLNNAIRMIAIPTETVSTLAGDPDASTTSGVHFVDGQAESALFYRPTGVVLDSQGNLYIADTGNNVIRMMDVNQNVTTIAGLGPSISNATGAGYQDGTGRQALFSSPIGITLGPDGNLYVVDSANNVVRKITLPGYVVTTIAGQAGQYGYSDGPGSSALFADITAITSDQDGNLYVPDTSHYNSDNSTSINNYVIRRLRPQSDGTYFVDTIIGDPSATSFVPGGSLPGDFKINGAGILADTANGYLYITAGQGIYEAPY